MSGRNASSASSLNARIQNILSEQSSDSEWDQVMDEHEAKMKEAEAAKYLVQTVEGIAHCHARGVIHRDIKSGNVLYDGEGNLKLTDFGFA